MKDKLAEEILNDTTYAGAYDNIERDELIKAMQAYHNAKMKEVTDDDIKKWALYDREYLIDYEVTTSSELNQRLKGREEGARDMRDGEIKHIEK
jgi:hypothetical protein